MTTRKSTNLKKAYEKDLETCRNINELVWIYTDFSKDENLTCDDLLSLVRNSNGKRSVFEKKGDRFRRAARPECRR